MTVRVNKSAFNIREKLSELERPIGVKGNELMRAETLQDARDLVSVGRKNLFINGDLRIWQRGTTVTAVGYNADRFMGYTTNTNTANYGLKVTQQQDSPIGLKGYCAEIALSNASGGGIDKVTFGQRIEAINFYGINSGDQLTFSFYIKRIQSADSDLTIYVKSAQNGINSYTNSTVNQNSYDVTVKSESLGAFNSIPTVWTKYSLTFTVTDALITNGGSIYIQNGNSNLNVTNTNALYRTTGWQLEVGKNATEFEHRSIGEELALCQRYFRRLTPVSNSAGGGWSDNYYRYGFGVANATNNVHVQIVHPVTMRTNASFSFSAAADFNLWNGTFYGITNISNGSYGTGSAVLSISATVPNKEPFELIANNRQTGYLDFNAEL